MTTVTIADPPEELREQVETAVAVASSYAAITCVEQRQAVGADLQVNKGLQKRVEDERLLIAKPLTEASRAVNALFKRMSEPLELAERAMKRAALIWDDEVDRQKMRAYREAARIADEQRRLTNQAADQAALVGDFESAAALAATAQMIAPVPVAVETAKVEGEAHSEIWRAECDDLPQLFAALGSGKVPLNGDEILRCVEFFGSLFGPRARSLKNALAIPGVKAVSERILRSRAA